MLKGIRAKSIFITVLVTLFSALSVLYLSINEHENIYRESVERNLDALTTTIAEELVAEVALSEDSYIIPSSILILDNFPEVKYGYILNADGEVMHQYIGSTLLNEKLENYPFKTPQQLTPSIGISVQGNNLIAYKVIGEQSYPLGYLLVVNDYAGPLEKSANRLLIKVLPTVLLAILLATLVSVWIHQRLLRQMVELSKFTRSIRKSDDYQLRFRVSGSDEVSDLGENINTMLETIEQQNKASEAQQQKLEQLANYDALTELPNRKFFMDILRAELANCRRAGRNLALLFLDLDNFKEINDSLGHDVGDQLLIRVAQRIKHELREGDILARLGGDEFLILIPEFEDSMGLGRVAQRLITIMKPAFNIQDWEVNTGVSIGIADSQSAEYDLTALVRNADMAMYQAKEQGRGRYAFFIQSLLEQSLRKINLANALASAIDNNELTVHYQAKVDQTETICGFEALARWQSSAEGFVSPAEFIPVAEQSGRVTSITKWMIKQVFREYHHVAAMCEAAPSISINLSAHDLKEASLEEFVSNTASHFDIDTQNIQFEVTESAYLDNFEQATSVLSSLRKKGFTIALDDFGTGYSSLSYLTRIKVDTLKIDREFIINLGQSENDTRIIETIFDLASALNLTVCAEGVETPEQAEFLIARRCNEMQGFLYAKPASLAELSDTISALSGKTKAVGHSRT